MSVTVANLLMRIPVAGASGVFQETPQGTAAQTTAKGAKKDALSAFVQTDGPSGQVNSTAKGRKPAPAQEDGPVGRPGVKTANWQAKPATPEFAAVLRSMRVYENPAPVQGIVDVVAGATLIRTQAAVTAPAYTGKTASIVPGPQSLVPLVSNGKAGPSPDRVLLQAASAPRRTPSANSIPQGRSAEAKPAEAPSKDLLTSRATSRAFLEPPAGQTKPMPSAAKTTAAQGEPVLSARSASELQKAVPTQAVAPKVSGALQDEAVPKVTAAKAGGPPLTQPIEAGEGRSDGATLQFLLRMGRAAGPQTSTAQRPSLNQAGSAAGQQAAFDSGMSAVSRPATAAARGVAQAGVLPQGNQQATVGAQAEQSGGEKKLGAVFAAAAKAAGQAGGDVTVRQGSVQGNPAQVGLAADGGQVDRGQMSPGPVAQPTAASAADQIAAAIRSSTGRQQQIIIHLDPPELGKVRMMLNADGKELHGVLQVENPRTLSQLQREAPILLDRLAEAGVQLRRMDMTLSDQGSTDAAAHWQSGSGGWAGHQGSGNDTLGQSSQPGSGQADPFATSATGLNGRSQWASEGSINVWI